MQKKKGVLLLFSLSYQVSLRAFSLYCRASPAVCQDAFVSLLYAVNKLSVQSSQSVCTETSSHQQVWYMPVYMNLDNRVCSDKVTDNGSDWDRWVCSRRLTWVGSIISSLAARGARSFIQLCELCIYFDRSRQ